MKNKKPLPIQFWILVFLAVLAVLVIAFSHILAPEKVALDKKNCPVDSALVGDYALAVVDGTDPILGEYKGEILRRMEEAARALPKHGKFSLHDISKGQERLMFRCATDTACNAATENCDKKERRYQKNYLNEITGEVGEFLKSSAESDSSPLIQRLSEIASLSDFQNAPSRSLHIFSDMLQHDGGYSHHRRRVADNEFAELSQQPGYQANKLPLQGVSVHVYYLQRNKYRHLQTPAHVKFWKELFADAGAASVDWHNINLPGEEAAVAPIIDNRPAAPPSKPAVPKRKPAPKPSPQSVPKPALTPQLEAPSSEPSMEEIAREHRENFLRYGDAKSLLYLVELHLSESIAPENKDMRDKIMATAVLSDNISPAVRGKVGELLFLGAGGFQSNIRDAYLLMSCAGGYEEEIRLMEGKLGLDVVESLENDLLGMRRTNRCG